MLISLPLAGLGRRRDLHGPFSFKLELKLAIQLFLSPTAFTFSPVVLETLNGQESVNQTFGSIELTRKC